MMSFKSEDLMINVLPAKNFDPANEEEGGNEPDCEATRPPKVYAAVGAEIDLPMLRRQLREALQ
jgi:hypothetical protein